MTGVSVRDVDAQKFIEAYAAFLKRQGKLPIPGMLRYFSGAREGTWFREGVCGRGQV